MVNIIYKDADIVVCIKPSGAISTDEPGGMPDLIRTAIDDSTAEVHTVHRLDRVVSGVMVYALNKKAASGLGQDVAERNFEKEYLAVIHGCPEEQKGRFDDLLFRDKSENKTYVVKRMRKGVRDAALQYEVLDSKNDLSLVKVHLLTGRTHQIRVQFSSRQMPLVGDKKYGAASDKCQIALWSYTLQFNHPVTNEKMCFVELPPNKEPWLLFNGYCTVREEDETELPERRKFRENQNQ